MRSTRHGGGTLFVDKPPEEALVVFFGANWVLTAALLCAMLERAETVTFTTVAPLLHRDSGDCGTGGTGLACGQTWKETVK